MKTQKMWPKTQVVTNVMLENHEINLPSSLVPPFSRTQTDVTCRRMYVHYIKRKAATTHKGGKRALVPTWHKNEVRAHPLLTSPTCCCCCFHWLSTTSKLAAHVRVPCVLAPQLHPQAINTHHPRTPVENPASLSRQRRATERPCKNTACSAAPPSCVAKTSTVYLHVLVGV